MNDIKGYNKFSKSKKVSELYLGTLDVNWEFAKIGYTAICTEALPLTFLEKMVCGIVDLDGRVCLEDLGHIMGFNIEDDVQKLKFKDKGETEILMETLQTLKQFGVIKTLDDSYSTIELTEIGKEYYAKGRKFRHGETKGFTMYFDITAGDHTRAKDLFSKVSVDGSAEIKDEQELPYYDEDFVKQYAESQVPMCYSEKTGNSFTDMSVMSCEFLYKKVVFCVIYDSFTETCRFEVVNNGAISSDYLSEFVNSNDNISHYLGLFLECQTTTTKVKTESQKNFEETIAKVQSDVEYALFNEQPERALALVSNCLKSPLYMEKQNIFNFIKGKIDEGSLKDIFINIPIMTSDDEAEIRSIAEDSNIRILLSCGNLNDFDTQFGENVLVLNDETDSQVILMLDDLTYRCEDLIFSIEDVNFSVEFLHKQDENSSEVLENIRQLYATRFVPYFLEKYEELLQEEEDESVLDRIGKLNGADNLLPFADSYVESTGNGEVLYALRAKRDDQLVELVEKYSNSMLEDLTNFRSNTPLEDIKTLDAMEKTISFFAEFKDKLIPEQSVDNKKCWAGSDITLALNNAISSYEGELTNRDTYLRQELLPKSYIIDTNVFVYFPEIMDLFNKEDRIVLSLRVLEELDKLKVALAGQNKQNVKKAIKEINYKIRMKSKTFRMESADTRLLPEEFDKTNSDNLILSVALKYSDRNPFLITNDINFQNRAASMGIPFKGLADLLPEDVYKTIDFTKPEKKKEPEPKKVQTNGPRNEDTAMPKALAKMMKRAYRACAEESDEVLVAKFVSEIKAIKPDFKPNTFGYSKFKDLCAAYPSEIELYENSNNALCIRLIESAVEERGNSQLGNLKDIESLNEEQQNMLKDLLVKMIDEEDSTSPTSDGEIRKAFIQMSGVHIKLKPVKQLRESLGIPSEKQRKSNFKNK